MTEKKGSGDSVDSDSVGPGSEGVGGSRPFIDDVFAVLADWRRREICQFFAEAEIETATVDDLAMLVAGCRPATTARTETESHDAIVENLHEIHLPKLDGAGVIDYDTRSRTVRYWGQPTLEKWLEHVTAVDRRTA